MADETRKDNTGVLFFNSYKEEDDNKPHLTGEAMVDGVTKTLAAWENESKKGKKYYSLVIKDKEDEVPC